MSKYYRNKNFINKFNPCPFCGKTNFEITPKKFYEELVKEKGSACICLRCCTCKVDMYEHTKNVTYEKMVKLLARKWNRVKK